MSGGLDSSVVLSICNKLKYEIFAISFNYKQSKKELGDVIINYMDSNDIPHFNLSDVFELTKKIKPKKTILTNLHSDVDYNHLKNKLPKNIIPAYDGLSFLI